MRALLRLAVATLLALVGLLGLPGRADAAGDFYGCVDAGNVWVVVDFKGAVTTGCAVAPTSGADALRQVAAVEVATGMVSRIGGKPATIDPNPYVYWNYFHRDPSGQSWGSWTYSNLGAGAYRPKPGSIEGWAYGTTGVQPSWTPPTRPVATTGAPAATPPAATQPATTAAAPRSTARTTAATTTAAPVPTTAAPVSTPTLVPSGPQSTSPEPTGAETPSLAAAPAATTASVAAAPSRPAEASRPVDRGSPVATIATLAVVATAAAGGGGWWLVRRRQPTR